MPKAHIVLSDVDQSELEILLSQSGLRSRVYKRVVVLLELNKGKTIEAVRQVVGLSYPTVAKLVDSYATQGLNCLQDKKQPGRPPRITGSQRATITALACSEAPDGHPCWTLRLLADKVVELNYCGTISHESVRQVLKKTK